MLYERGFVTQRPRYAMQALDGTVIEVFEWLSPEAIECAHADPDVQTVWREFEHICE